MDNRINKPRVFLSHSKKNIDFIDRIYADLKKCQIEPWLDSQEIRHGHPWLDAIFEDGLPTCDCVLVYLSEQSIESNMVKKEIDSGIIQKLKDSSISFLPYVSEQSIRHKLRSDLQALQAPELNEENYNEMFPRIVSEIWRSYLERTILSATKIEKVRRLEAELELEKIKSASNKDIFPPGEMADLEYIYHALSRKEGFTIEVSYLVQVGDNKTDWVVKEVKHYEVLVSSLLPHVSSSRDYEFSNSSIRNLLHDKIHAAYKDEKDKVRRVDCTKYPFLSDELLMYGLIKREHRSSTDSENSLARMMHRSEILVYTDKVEKIKYWMSYNKILADEIIINQLPD